VKEQELVSIYAILQCKCHTLKVGELNVLCFSKHVRQI
jgi:hypothetical protein